MKAQSSLCLVSTVFMTALLGGCGSSSGTSVAGLLDDQVDADAVTDTVFDTSTDTEIVTGTETGTETETDTVIDTGSEAEIDTGIDVETSTDTENDTGTDSVPDTGANAEIDTGSETGTGTDTVIDTNAEKPPTSDLDILVPNVAADSDLERLLTGIKRQVSVTLIDLNQRISQGVELTDQQDICLGPFDPAVGEQLLAIDCEQPLATGDVRVYVREAAFYNTENCHASIFSGNTDNCQLQRADIDLHDLFSEGERRPVLVYAGSNVNYALTDTILHIGSLEPALTGTFSCDINLTSGNSSSLLDGTSCDSVITARANHLDDVLPPK